VAGGVAAAVAVAGAAVLIVWASFGGPPPGLLARHGLPWRGAPGARAEVHEGVEFVELPPGYLLTGSCCRCDRGDLRGRLSALLGFESGRAPRHALVECPRRWREVPITLFVARTEVTRAQFARFDPGRKWTSFSAGDHAPVTLGAAEAGAYCEWLAGRSGRPVRLPTPTEWEYACRGGCRGEYGFTGDARQLGDFAWYERNSGLRAHDVAGKRPNGRGLFDLHGNAAEWCVGPGGEWMLAGGSARDGAEDCRAASRRPARDVASGEEGGVRPVFELPEALAAGGR
jgi:formylglycine-generating enzyme required for sulfatase activity